MSAMSDTSMNTNMHAAFKREIARIRAAVDKVDLTKPEQCAGLARRYAFFSETLHHHHQGEDTYLFERVKPLADDAEKEILNEMETEHHRMLDVLNQLDQEFANLTPDTDKAQLTQHLDSLLDVLGRHCDHEEAQGMAVVQKYITKEDLKEFMKYNRSAEHANLVLPWVCDNAAPGVADQTWGMIPGPVRMFLRPSMTKKYDAFSKECGV